MGKSAGFLDPAQWRRRDFQRRPPRGTGSSPTPVIVLRVQYSVLNRRVGMGARSASHTSLAVLCLPNDELWAVLPSPEPWYSDELVHLAILKIIFVRFFFLVRFARGEAIGLFCI